MHHGPAVKLDEDLAAKKKSNLGLILFFIYLSIYAGFVFIGLYNPEMFGEKALGNQNLAIVYGFGLIVLAIVMGFIYNLMCTSIENKMNKK
jgi:uncharacterized membrane protein (DUF485 family)